MFGFIRIHQRKGDDFTLNGAKEGEREREKE